LQQRRPRIGEGKLAGYIENQNVQEAGRNFTGLARSRSAVNLGNCRRLCEFAIRGSCGNSCHLTPPWRARNACGSCDARNAVGALNT
jgi:hypothetical protein